MTELQRSYRFCRAICQKSKSSFLPSFALLPPSQRTGMYALYAFARLSDDLADGPGTPDERREKLASWSSQLTIGMQTEHDCRDLQISAGDSIWPALRDTAMRFSIPVQLLEEIVAGVSYDIDQQQPADWDELQDYCYHVASTIGLACVQIWRNETSEPKPNQNAIDCGIAFQLTNILRDIAEDAKAGRIYLPKSSFEKYGVDVERWLSGAPPAGWEPMIDEYVDLAYQHYDQGWSVIDGLTPRGQRMFSLMWRSYRALLDEVVANRGRLWQASKTRLTTKRKLSLYASHYLPPLYLRLPVPCANN